MVLRRFFRIGSIGLARFVRFGRLLLADDPAKARVADRDISLATHFGPDRSSPVSAFPASVRSSSVEHDLAMDSRHLVDGWYDAGDVWLRRGFDVCKSSMATQEQKSQLPISPLPSLEYLQSLGSASLFASASCIALGLVSGVILNLQRGVQAFWLDAGVLFSTGLLVWLAIAFVLQWHLSKRGLERWTAYLNMISFAFMSLALVIVASSPHGRKADATERTLPAIPSSGSPDADASAGRVE